MITLENPRIVICSTPVDAITRTEALERCRSFLRSGTQRHIVTVNPEFVVEARKNRVFREILRKSDLALPDGSGIVLAARLLGLPLPERISGTDFLVELCGIAGKERASVFFLGGRHGAAEGTARAMLKRFPGLHIAGWSESDWRSPELINATKPAILFVAFGAPKQELWIAENLKNLPSVKIAMGVGGAFDYLSGNIRRAPGLVRRAGFEWLWRLMREPWRLRRVCAATIGFPAALLSEMKKPRA